MRKLRKLRTLSVVGAVALTLGVIAMEHIFDETTSAPTSALALAAPGLQA